VSDLVLREEPAPAGDLLAHFAASRDETALYWERPDRGEALLALGAAAVVEAEGEGRFARLDTAARQLFARLRLAGPAAPGLGPRLAGGFAFDERATQGPAGGSRWAGFPAARLVLPRRLVVRRRAASAAWVVDGAEPAREPSRLGAGRPAPVRDAESAPSFIVQAEHPLAHYRTGVRAALAAIEAGSLEKLVLARSCQVSGRRPFDAGALLAVLRPLHPACTLFAVRFAGATLIGATPELLVGLEAGRVETAALAGSAPRGRSPREDRALARALRESKKEQEEHAIVVRALREALAGCCDELSVPEAPGLLATEGIQHLHTPLRGRLAAGSARGVLDLVSRLHPTPAVGGAPRRAALSWLRRHEGLDRGWYAGGVGFLDAAGEGAFAVPLRVALLRGEHAALFAGAGIVRGSDPEAELAETRLKLRAVLGPLVEI
jgi:isochorismate synthase